MINQKNEFLPPTKPENGSMQIQEIAKALNLLQANMKNAFKDSDNPFFHSTFASMKSTWEAVKDSMREYGLSYTQTFDPSEGKTILVTTLMHNSGQWIRSSFPMKVTKDDMLGHGAAITYFSRYCLQRILGVVTEDGDGDVISEKQATLMLNKMTALKWPPEKMAGFLKSWNYKKITQIYREDFDPMMTQLTNT